MKWVRVRLLAAAVVLTGLLVALGAKAWTLQIRDGARMRALGEEQYLQELVLPAPRGSIHDANGVKFCNKENAQVALLGIPLSTYKECELFEIDDLSLFFILNMASNSVKADSSRQETTYNKASFG